MRRGGPVQRALARWGCGLAVVATLLAGCGDPFINPPRNLARPSAILALTDAAAGVDSAEYLFVLDTERAQLVLIDAAAGFLTDLRPEIPGFNGVFLGGQPSAIAATSDSKEVVVVNFGLGVLQIVCTPFGGIDCPRTEVVATVDAGPAPEHIAIAGTHAYVTRPRDGVVVDVDLRARRVVGFFDVGGAPRGIATSADATKLWVTDSDGTALTRITLATRELKSVDVGAPTDLVFVAPSPEWVYAIHTDKGSLLVVNPRTEALENPFPDGPPGAGPDVELLGRATGMSFVSYSAAEARTLGIGQFAFVSSADGFVYVIATEGAVPHQIANRTPTPVVDGSAVCLTADPPANGAAIADCPSLQVPPVFSFGATVLPIVDESPRIRGHDIPPRHGIVFAGGRRVVRTERWSLTFQGALPGAAPSPARIEPGNIIVNPDVNYNELLRVGTTEPVVQDGDHFIFLDAPTPRGEVSCAGVAVDSEGFARRWPIARVPGNPHALRLVPPEGAMLPPIADCYTQGTVVYIIRAATDWVVIGNKAGYQGRARECPLDLPEANCFPFEYQNVFFRLTMRRGTAPSEPETRWSFDVGDGVVGQQVSLNVSFGLAGLPKGIATSKRPQKTIFVADEGDEAILFIDPATLIIERIIR